MSSACPWPVTPGGRGDDQRWTTADSVMSYNAGPEDGIRRFPPTISRHWCIYGAWKAIPWRRISTQISTSEQGRDETVQVARREALHIGGGQSGGGDPGRGDGGRGDGGRGLD